ncbi:hypothetical protein F5Y14DRAFT_21831 [Nemania sp. NC0429]|nr:hypothetical protein F5Y14DRAFT_21831 [Nemania sp. NC0429]
MYDEVIPLFEDDDSGTGYQLHPFFTNLTLGNTARNPHPDVFCLSVDGNRNSSNKPDLIMGIGKLFVNINEEHREKPVSKWTEYEVFVDFNLGLWMIFDDKATLHDYNGWCKLDSELANPQGKNLEDRKPIFTYAKFSTSLREVESAFFADALALVQDTKIKLLKPARVSQAENQEINDILYIRRSQ